VNIYKYLDKLEFDSKLILDVSSISTMNVPIFIAIYFAFRAIIFESYIKSWKAIKVAIVQ